MVWTLWGNDGKTKPLPPASQHPSQIFGGGDEEGVGRLRKPLPIVLLPSLVVVSTVWIATRVPLFLFGCTPADPSAVMF